MSENKILLNSGSLEDLTEEIEMSAKSYDSARITRYVMELAALFHKFYNSWQEHNSREIN